MKTARIVSVSLFVACLFAGFWLGKAAGQAGFTKITHFLDTPATTKGPGAGEDGLHSLENRGNGSGILYPLPAYLTVQAEMPHLAAPSYPLPVDTEVNEEAPAQAPQAYPLPEEVISSHQPGASLPVVEEANPGQHNLLVIGVNQVGGPNLTLEGIWLVLYRQDAPRFTFMPIFPGQGAASQAAEALADSFSLDTYGNPEASFLSALQAQHLWWNDYVVLDETAMAEMINFVGGVTLGNTIMDGPHAIANMPDVLLAPQDALRAQGEVIKDICSHATRPELSDRIEALLRLTPEHLNTNMDLEQALTQWERFRSSGPFACEFPLLWPNH
jgi:hypothetical protein